MNAEADFQYIGVTSTNVASGPRHLAFHPTMSRCYVLTELSPAVEVFSYENAAASFSRLQTIPTIQDSITVGRINPAAIKIHPNGQFLYVSNRGVEGAAAQSIVQYKIDETEGTLTFVGKQSTKGLVPRDFTFDPSGQFMLVANQNSDNIVTFRINATTGQLEETGQSFEVATPVCLVFGGE